MAQQIPSFGTRLGLLYKIWMLNCIPNLGHAVSLDFINRPDLYKQVKGGNTVKNLTDMQSLYGYAPNFPGDDIRLMLMQPIFGASDGHGSGNDGSDFQDARMPVLAAAAATPYKKQVSVAKALTISGKGSQALFWGLLELWSDSRSVVVA